MKYLEKIVMFICIIAALVVIVSFLFFPCCIQDGERFSILCSAYKILLLCIICLVVLEIKGETNIKKAKLEKIKTLIEDINKIQEDPCLKDNVKEIKKNIVEIKGKIKDLQSNKANCGDLNEVIKELSEKMCELEIILQPLSFKSDIFKAYANAIVEI